MNVEIAVFLLIFLSISSLATIGICFVEFRQNAAFLFPSNVQNIGETFMVFTCVERKSTNDNWSPPPKVMF